MKTVAAFVVVLLTAGVGTAQAAEITFERAFDIGGEDFYPGSPLDTFRFKYYLGPQQIHWTVPAFDSSLGILEVLQVDIEGTASISGRVHDLGGLPEIGLFAIGNSRRPGDISQAEQVGVVGGGQRCTEPCDFFFRTMNEEGQPTEFRLTGWYWPGQDDFPVTVRLGFTADTFLTYELAAATTIRTSFTGVARATYIYEPFAEPIPEPSTLLLLGSGLIAARVRRSRRHG